jgi:hypothetical protein
MHHYHVRERLPALVTRAWATRALLSAFPLHSLTDG